MDINYYNLGEIRDEQFKFAVICSAYKGKWIYVRHRDRITWEIPGGHKEEDEDVNETASRELYEETGAIEYKIEPVCDYSVTLGEMTTFGRLFYAKVDRIGFLPESEIREIGLLKELPDNLTYPDIQPRLLTKVMEYIIDKILKLLEKDRTRNVSIINFIKNYPSQTFDIVGESVLIRGRSDEDWVYISSKSKEEFIQLIKGLDDEDKCFAALEDWMLPYIVKDREIKSTLACTRLVYDEKAPLPPVVSDVVDLSTGDAEYIYHNSKYKEYLTVEYIQDRIENGIAIGVYENGRLVAWAITHDDGAIGFLNVMEGYRGKGYGMDLTVTLIKRLLKLSMLPFVHIEEENIKSMNLALKVGFRKDRRIHWVKLN